MIYSTQRQCGSKQQQFHVCHNHRQQTVKIWYMLVENEGSSTEIWVVGDAEQLHGEQTPSIIKNTIKLSSVVF